jgi:hypothetical protein
MENTSTAEEKALRPRMEKIFSSGDIVTIKHDIPNKLSMIVQSIDKLPVSSGRYSLFRLLTPPVIDSPQRYKTLPLTDHN